MRQVAEFARHKRANHRLSQISDYGRAWPQDTIRHRDVRHQAARARVAALAYSDPSLSEKSALTSPF